LAKQVKKVGKHCSVWILGRGGKEGEKTGKGKTCRRKEGEMQRQMRSRN